MKDLESFFMASRQLPVRGEHPFGKSHRHVFNGRETKGERDANPKKTLGLFDPGIENNEGGPSANLGDLIIQRVVERELGRLFKGADLLRISTHVPLASAHVRRLRTCRQLFVGGTNLLSSKMRDYKQWQISWRDAWNIRRAILFGVGWWQYQETPDWYTRFVLRGALSSRALHSVRDEYTRQKLSAIGIHNVVNTGCPTMWPLADRNSGSMPSTKSEVALVMLTDYSPNPESDSRLLKLVTTSYKKVFFWPQGRKDIQYVSTLNTPMEILPHSLAALDKFLAAGIQFDYIGTRLHGGIQCLLGGHRGLVLEVDNRAREIARDSGLPTAERGDFEFIKRWIAGPTVTPIKLNTAGIELWRNQFRDSAGVAKIA